MSDLFAGKKKLVTLRAITKGMPYQHSLSN